MKTPDLDRMSLKQLRALGERIDAAIDRRKGRQPLVLWSDPIERAKRQAEARKRFMRTGK